MAPRQSLHAVLPVPSQEHGRSAISLPGLPLQSQNDSIPLKNPNSSKNSRRTQLSNKPTTRTALVDLNTRSEELLTLPISAQQLRSHPSASLSEDRPTLERHAVSNPERYRKPKTKRFDDRPIPAPRLRLEETKPSTSAKTVSAGRGLLELEESPSAEVRFYRKEITDTTNTKQPKQTVKAKQPLNQEDTTNPDGTTNSTSPRSSPNILEVHNRLQNLFESNLTPCDEQGSIYVFLDPKRPELRKIGRSKDIDTRKKAIEFDCGLSLQLVHYRTVNYYKRAEDLIQRDLEDLCRPYICEECGKKHGEWFRLGDQLARTTVNKWVDFIRQERPYDASSRELRPFWKHQISTKEPLFKHKNLDIDTLRMYWSHALSPNLLVRLDYEISTLRAHAVWKFLWKFWWQVNAAGAWTITFIAFQNHATFLIMLLSILGSFISISNDFGQFPSALSPGKGPSSLPQRNRKV
jgi:hypothetical protein